MTGIITTQNNELSPWIALYIHTEMCHLYESLEALSSKTESWKVRTDEHKLQFKILILAIHTTRPITSMTAIGVPPVCQAALVDNPRIVLTE